MVCVQLDAELARELFHTSRLYRAERKRLFPLSFFFKSILRGIMTHVTFLKLFLSAHLNYHLDIYLGVHPAFDDTFQTEKKHTKTIENSKR